MSKDNCESAVKIAVRERPSKEGNSILYFANEAKNVLVASDRAFCFDYIFRSNSTQKDVFNCLAEPLIEKTQQGYNCNIFAYGQTGTGKTFTMGLTQNFENDFAGIIPRCLYKIFDARYKFDKIFVSYIEIYNEKVFDMLSSDSTTQINVKGFKFSGGSKKQIESAEEGFQFLNEGNSNRHVRPTKLNTQSSRSHAIFTIHVERTTNGISYFSKLNLVDLAGSEGIRRTGHQGLAMYEGVNINQGLLSLGKVVQALNSGSKVIPYRDSILTSVLQDSLCQSSYLTLLACISPDKADKSETMSTLRFAQSTKILRNIPVMNAVMVEYQSNKIKTPKKTPFKANNNFKSHSRLGVHPYNKITSSVKKFNSFSSPSTTLQKIPKRFNSVECLNAINPFVINRKIQEKNSKLSIESRESISSLLNASSSTSVDASSVTIENFKVPMQQVEENSNKYFAKSSAINMESKNLRDLVRQEIYNFIWMDKHENAQKTENSENSINGRNVIKNGLQSESNFNLVDYFINSLETGIVKNLESIKTTNNIEVKENSPTNVENHEAFHNTKPQLVDPETMLVTGDSSFTEHEENLLLSKHNISFKSTKNSPMVSVRRSLRLEFQSALKRGPLDRSKHEDSQNISMQSFSNDPNLSHKPSRRSIRLANKTPRKIQSPVLTISKKQKVQNSKKKLPTINEVFSNYFETNNNGNKKIKTQNHQKAVLNILNNGSLKELQILPHVGLKTAYQILTYRTINGKFRNLEVVSKLPVWRGKAWERFKEANFL